MLSLGMGDVNAVSKGKWDHGDDDSVQEDILGRLGIQRTLGKDVLTVKTDQQTAYWMKILEERNSRKMGLLPRRGIMWSSKALFLSHRPMVLEFHKNSGQALHG